MEIVGLKQKVDNDINKLIAKFVGIKPRKITEEMKYFINDYHRLIWGYKYDDDEVIKHYNYFNDKSILFYTHVLWNKVVRPNCGRCHKYKRDDNCILYCKRCDIIEFKEYQERCKNSGFGDGCD